MLFINCSMRSYSGFRNFSTVINSLILLFFSPKLTNLLIEFINKQSNPRPLRPKFFNSLYQITIHVPRGEPSCGRVRSGPGSLGSARGRRDAPPGCRYVHTTSDLGLTLPHSHTFPLNPVFDCLRLRAHLTATACTAPLSFTTIIVLTSSTHWSTFHQDTVTTTTAVLSSSPTG